MSDREIVDENTPSGQFSSYSPVIPPSTLNGTALGDPPAGGTAKRSLPCQSGIKCNEDENTYKMDDSCTSRTYGKKRLHCVRMEIQRFIEEYGIERVGFLTLTFADDLQDLPEAKKRWKSLRTGFIGEIAESFIVVWERQGSGRLHAHLVLACRGDVRTGVRWRQCRKKHWSYAGGAGPYLIGLWGQLRDRLPKYGFGRHELLPVRTCTEQIARYVAKYLSKSVLRECDRGQRLIEYSQKGRCYRPNFSWYSASNYKYRLLVQRAAKVAHKPDMGFLCDWMREQRRKGGASLWWTDREIWREGLPTEKMTPVEWERYLTLKSDHLVGRWSRKCVDDATGEMQWLQCQGETINECGIPVISFSYKGMTMRELWDRASARYSQDGARAPRAP